MDNEWEERASKGKTTTTTGDWRRARPISRAI